MALAMILVFTVWVRVLTCITRLGFRILALLG